MKPNMKAWLPEDALDPAVLASLLAAVLKPWAEHWFGEIDVSVMPLSRDDWPQPGPSLGWRSLPSNASVALTTLAQCGIASTMLGHQIVPGSLQPNDRVIIQILAAACSDDLLRRIAPEDARERICSSPIDLDDCGWWEVSLDRGKQAFKLALASTAQIAMVKAELSPAPRARLDPIASGLAQQKIMLVAALGRCSINLSELGQLDPGDVLVLDQSSELPFDILLGSDRSSIRANLESIGGQATLVVTALEGSAHA